MSPAVAKTSSGSAANIMHTQSKTLRACASRFFLMWESSCFLFIFYLFRRLIQMTVKAVATIKVMIAVST